MELQKQTVKFSRAGAADTRSKGTLLRHIRPFQSLSCTVIWQEVKQGYAIEAQLSQTKYGNLMESELPKKIQQQDTSKTEPALSKTDLAPGLSPSVDPIPSYISCRPKTRIESAALVIVSCEYMACICRN